MASGHVNRIKRPNTWLHRPMLQNREESSCQTGAVHTWHKADVPTAAKNVRSLDNSRHRLVVLKAYFMSERLKASLDLNHAASLRLV